MDRNQFDEILDRINHYSEQKKGIKTKWIWYSAAAVLLIGVIIGRFLIPDIGGQTYNSESATETLSYLITSEDWNRLEEVLSNEDEFKKYAGETISIHILIDKLSALKRMGIQTLPISLPPNPDQNKESVTILNDLQIQLSLNKFIQLLEQAKKQQSQISLSDVSKLYTKL